MHRPHRGGDGPGLAGGPGLDRRATDPAGLGRGRHGLSLAGEGPVHHGPRDRLTDPDGELLQVGELGAPGQALGPEDLLEEMFRDPLDQRLLIDDDRGRIDDVSHP
jgi:hypothetical protein